MPDLAIHLGFPLAEIHDDGTSVITKHSGTGGQVSVGTVTAQLLYEIGGPDTPIRTSPRGWTPPGHPGRSRPGPDLRWRARRAAASDAKVS